MSGRSASALSCSVAIAVGGVLVHAQMLRAEGAEGLVLAASIARATGNADLALSSGARWLRHPSSAEPAAGCSGPTCLDMDPAGLALPPPRATFGADERRMWVLESE